MYIPRFCLLDLISMIYEQVGFTLFNQRSKIISHISNTFINTDSVFIDVKRVNDRQREDGEKETGRYRSTQGEIERKLQGTQSKTKQTDRKKERDSDLI